MQPSAKIVGPALYEELDRNVPAMLQGHVPDIAGELAYRLCAQAGGRMSKVFFCSSGSEGVEATFKVCPRPHQAPGHSLCRWRISRPYLRCAIADGQSVLDCGIWSIAAGHEVRSLRDLEQLRSRLSSKKYGAFIVEPIQAEAGVLL